MPLFGGMLNTDRLNRALTSLSSKGSSTFSFRNSEEERNRSPSSKDIASTLSSVADIVACSIRDEEKRTKKKSITSVASSCSSASKENTPTNMPSKCEGNSTVSARSHHSRKSLSTPLSQKRRDVNSSEKKKMSKHLQERMFSSSPPLSTPQMAAKFHEEDELMAHRIAAKCLEEDELEARLRETNSNDIVSVLKQEIFSIREELRSSRADAALNKKALSATKSKLDETLEELLKTKEDLVMIERDRDEIRLLFQSHRCNQSSPGSIREEMEATQEQLKQALDEIQKLNNRLRLAKNLSISTKVQLDQALEELERLKKDQCGVNRLTVNTNEGHESESISGSYINTGLGVGAKAYSSDSSIYHTPSKRSVVSSPLRPPSSRSKKSQQSDITVSDQLQLRDKFSFTSMTISDGGNPQGHSSDSFENTLLQFYRIHNPNKLHEVKKLLLKYDGRKLDLVEHLEKKYKSSFF